MHIKRIASVFAIAASAGALLAAGSAAAATQSPAAGAASAIRTTAASGAVHFIGFSQNSDGPDFTVILTGAVGDYGPAVTVHPNCTVDPEHSSELRLRLRNGSFRLNIANLDKKVIFADTHWPSYSRTRSFYLSVTAATPIVAGSGTGSYRGISGSITMTVTIGEVDKTHANGPFLAQLIFFTGSGSVSLR